MPNGALVEDAMEMPIETIEVDSIRGAAVDERDTVLVSSAGGEEEADLAVVLGEDLTIRVVVHTARNPLRSADPERLRRYKAALRDVIAARRAAVDAGDD